MKQSTSTKQTRSAEADARFLPSDPEDWKKQYRDKKQKRREEIIVIMKWWRKQHPEFSDVKVISHGWHGHCVRATFCNERSIVATIADVRKERAKAEGSAQ